MGAQEASVVAVSLHCSCRWATGSGFPGSGTSGQIRETCWSIVLDAESDGNLNREPDIHALVSARVVIAYEWMTERRAGRLFSLPNVIASGSQHGGTGSLRGRRQLTLQLQVGNEVGLSGSRDFRTNRETCWSIVLDAESDGNLNREPDIHALVSARVVIAYEWMTERRAGRLFSPAERYCVGLSTWGRRKPPWSPSAYTAAAGGRGFGFPA